MPRVKLLRVALLKCLEPVTAIGCGLGALALGTLDGGITAGAVIGGSGLIRAYGEARSQHGLDSQKHMDRTRLAIDRAYNRDTLDTAGRASLIRADEALAKHLVNAVPDRVALGAAAVNVERYPVAACALILARLEGLDPLFRDDAIARDFATQVITAALGEALNNPDYIALLSVHILTAIGQGVAELKEGQTKDRARDEAFQDDTAEAMRQILERLNADDKKTIDKIKREVEKAITNHPQMAQAEIVEQVIFLIESREQALTKLAANPAEDNRIRSFQAAAEQALERNDDASAITALEQAEAAIGERQEADARASASYANIRAGLLLGQGDWQSADIAWAQAAAMVMPFDVDAGENIVWDAAMNLLQFGETFGRTPALVASAQRWRALKTVEIARGDAVRTANVQNNLGNVLQILSERTGGEAGFALLGQAVAAYRAALTVYTKAAMPTEWAMTQNNLGIVFTRQGERTGGDAGLDLLHQAVAAFHAALTVRTEAAMPIDWAMTQNNLGAVLRSQGERTGGEAGLDLLGEAVDAYRAALTVHTEAAMPAEWAGTQNNLGLVLTRQGERTGGEAGLDLLRQAVAAFHAALRVYTPAQFPYYNKQITKNLARAEAAIAALRG